MIHLRFLLLLFSAPLLLEGATASLENTQGAHAISTEQCALGSMNSLYYLVPREETLAIARLFYRFSIDASKTLPSFNFFYGKRTINEQYYDNINRNVLLSRSYVKYSHNTSLNKIRSDKENIQLGLSSEGLGQLELHEFEVENYNRPTSSFDYHKLAKKIRRKDRALFADLISKMNDTKWDTLFPIMNVERQQELKHLTHFGKPVVDVILERISIGNFNIPNETLMIGITVHSKELKQLNDKEVNWLSNFVCDVYSGVAQKPKSFGNEKLYKNFLHIAESGFPYRTFFLHYPLLFNLASAIFLIIIFGMIFYLVKRNRQAKHLKMICSRSNR